MSRICQVYVDYRLDTNAPFYVGVGTAARVKLPWRNDFHNKIVKKYGFRREVVLSTKDYEFALEVEKQLIRDLKTHKRDGGTNLTEGGEGSLGWNPTIVTRQRMRAARLGKKMRAVLTATIVREILHQYSQLDHSIRGVKSKFVNEWGKKFGVTGECIRRIVKGSSWKDITR